MNRPEIIGRVKEIVASNVDFDPKRVRLTELVKIKEDLGADSLDAVEISIDLDKEFGIKTDDQDIEKIYNGTLSDIVDVVEEALNKKQHRAGK